jgi:hypothetical protein
MIAPHSHPDYSEVGISSAGMNGPNKDSSEFLRRRGVADIASVLRAEDVGERASRNGGALKAGVLGCGSESLYVPKLGQERVLIVVATARHLLVEVADFTEWQSHPTSGRLERTEWPVVYTFRGKPGDDNVSRVNVFRVHDSGSEKAVAHASVHSRNLSRTFRLRPRALSV